MNPAFAAVRASYAAIAPRSDELVKRFYENLFHARPEMRALFPQDLKRQREHVGAAIAVIIRNLDSLDALEGTLMSLGARHVSYGVAPEHYPPVRDALVDAVSCMGLSMSAELREAWLVVVNRVCATMLRGAAGAALAMAQDMSPIRPSETTILGPPLHMT